MGDKTDNKFYRILQDFIDQILMIRLLWSESHDSTAMHGQSTAAKVRLQWLQFCGQWDHVGKDGDRAWNCHVELERLSLIHTSQHIFRTGDISDICISKKKG